MTADDIMAREAGMPIDDEQVAALASAIQEKAKEIHRMTSVTVSMQWKNLYH